MKLRKLVLVVLVVLASLDMCAQSVDKNGKILPVIASAVQTELDGKANLASPALTGTPSAPTAGIGTNSTQLATTAYVDRVAPTSSNFVDLITDQTIAGDKKFSSGIIVDGLLNISLGNGGHYTSVAVGANALTSNVDGTRNTAIGSFALKDNTASENTAIGYYTLRNNTIGSSNLAVGAYAGDIITTGSQNTLLGRETDPNSLDGVNQTVIGYNARGAGNNTVQLGNTSVTQVNTSGTITAGAVTYTNIDGSNGEVLMTNGNGSTNWVSPSGSNYIVTKVTTTPYTIAGTPSNLYAVDASSANITLNLPSITSSPMVLTISDFKGYSNSNWITINANGSDLIKGSMSLIMLSNYQTITLMSVPDTGIWVLK